MQHGKQQDKGYKADTIYPLQSPQNPIQQIFTNIQIWLIHTNILHSLVRLLVYGKNTCLSSRKVNVIGAGPLFSVQVVNSGCIGPNETLII